MSERESYPSEDQIKEALNAACDKVEERDGDLLCKNVNERSITHRLAIYLEEEIAKVSKGWLVDCEYNRMTNGSEISPKTIRFRPIPKPKNGYDTEARTVFPDIIVHSRTKSGLEGGNLLVIEAKKNSLKLDNDVKKLAAYCKQLKYKYAAMITFKVDQSKDCERSSSEKITIKWMDPATGKLKQ